MRSRVGTRESAVGSNRVDRTGVPMSTRLMAMMLAGLLGAPPTLAQDTDAGPPPGRLVDVGGRVLHLQCAGSGAPTVVIEAGASSFAIDFALVQPAAAKATRVCSYDRAGSGWSAARADVETPIRVVRDLRALLDAAGEKGPFVMVGASRGGLYVRLFQAEYAADVAGLVLVDPAVEDRLFTMYQGKPVPIVSLTADQYRSLSPRGAVPIPTRQPQTGAPFDRLPPDLYTRRVALERRLIASMPATVPAEVVAESSEGDYAMLSRLHAARMSTPTLLGDLPLVVLTRGLSNSPDQQAAHAALATMSRNARHAVVPMSYHEIHLSHPEAVITATADVVSAARDRRPLR
jgi:pimeloyl-ACP methyl ester carboxylesterase